MTYKRKTEDVWEIHVMYGSLYGWEYETTEMSWREARDQLKCYRENAPQYPVRVVKRRVPIAEAA